MIGLGEDYERWASDSSYRAARMLLEEDLKAELESERGGASNKSFFSI